MRQRPHDIAEKGRFSVSGFPETGHGDRVGWFMLKCPATGGVLRVLASDGEGWPYEPPPWEHVSVSLADRCPTWEEMCFVKNLFWEPHEEVVQFHPAKSDYVNFHPHTLHLWKPVGVKFLMPPSETVGPKKEPSTARNP